jgi:purine-cytosine permease-like protein
MTKKKYQDWILGILLTAVTFFGIYLIDKIKDIQTMNPILLFIISAVGLTLSIKFIKIVLWR